MEGMNTETEWYSLKKTEVLDQLGTSEEGLTEDEAQNRLSHFGHNTIGEEIKVSPWKVVLKQFQSPLIYVLLFSMIITSWLERWDDTIIIAVILVINATIGFFQEYKAENSIKALMSMVSPKALVKRNGKYKETPVEMIVPGDIVKLEEGKVVPADARILRNRSLHVSEAALTGESVPVAKTAQAVNKESLPVSEMENLLFMGTSVTSGSAEAIVIGTGKLTQIGKIAEDVRRVAHTGTPLQARMAKMAKWIVIVLFFVILLCFSIGVLSGRTVEDMFLLSVSLAVGAIPEGLPIVMSIALAIGVKRMARKGAIIRKLPAVETLGSTTVILSDKTGTITQNKMTVTEIMTDNQIKRNSDKKRLRPENNKALFYTLAGGSLNNGVVYKEESWQGDPMDVAMRIAAEEQRLGTDKLFERFDQIDSIPFKTEERYSASIHIDRENKNEKIMFVKGAPERILNMCRSFMKEDGSEKDLDAESTFGIIDRMADDGLRVLALAIGYGDEVVNELKAGNTSSLIFTGALGLLDPPRKEALDAIEMCHQAGIRVMMLTGDHRKTAAAIARKVNLIKIGKSTEAVTGNELKVMNQYELRDTIQKTNVFARVEPSQKLRIVEFLKDEGEIVAVTGDGVNDAPALKSAHLGVAMGKSGTDVAKESSDMVITDDNFSSIFEAVKAGRTAFRNIRMATYFLLSTGAAQVMIILSSLVMVLPLPLLPAQILWINVVTNGIQDVALAFEKGNKELYSKPPRSPQEGVMNWPLVERTILIGIWFTICTLGVFLWDLRRNPGNLIEARTTAVTTLVLLQIFQLFNCRRENESIFKTNLFSNKWVLFTFVATAVHVGSLYWSFTQDFLSFAPLPIESWMLMVPIGATAILINEIHKWFCRKNGYGITRGEIFFWMANKINGIEKKELKKKVDKISSQLDRQQEKLDRILKIEEERKWH
ncbi:MAG: cation-translocating P-type ATPase [Bacteriovoracia bacterium]